MALRAASHCVLVSPTGDHNETEHGRLIVVQNDNPQRQVYRGVVLDVGSQVAQIMDIVRGNVLHYTGFEELMRGEDTLHVVGSTYILAWDDDE